MQAGTQLTQDQRIGMPVFSDEESTHRQSDYQDILLPLISQSQRLGKIGDAGFHRRLQGGQQRTAIHLPQLLHQAFTDHGRAAGRIVYPQIRRPPLFIHPYPHHHHPTEALGQKEQHPPQEFSNFIRHRPHAQHAVGRLFGVQDEAIRLPPVVVDRQKRDAPAEVQIPTPGQCEFQWLIGR